MNNQHSALSVSLMPVEAADVVSYDHLADSKPSKQEAQRQQTHSLTMSGIRITVRSEAGVLCQVLIEIDSNRNGSFNDINDAFFSIDAQAMRIAAGMGDAGGVIQNTQVVSAMLAFINQLTIVDPQSFEHDMRALSLYVSQTTDLVVKAVAGGR